MGVPVTYHLPAREVTGSLTDADPGLAVRNLLSKARDRLPEAGTAALLHLPRPPLSMWKEEERTQPGLDACAPSHVGPHMLPAELCTVHRSTA